MNSHRPSEKNFEKRDVTQLLHAASSGERADLDALMNAIYDELRRLAVKHMQAERGNHTLQPTAVVHEAYIKLIDQRSADWNDRVHFFAIASRIIRQILVDHARAHKAEKRGGGAARLPLDAGQSVAAEPNVDLIALDEALTALHELNERQAQVVEMRFFGGLTIDEIAESLGIGKRSVDREWKVARAWLFCQINEAGTRDEI